MIKNIVLDIGNVLATFCWEKVMKEDMHLEGTTFNEVADATVKSTMWNQLDEGIQTDEEIINECISRAPQHKAIIQDFFTHLGELVIPYDYSQTWIDELKKKGYKVYILSNFGKTSYEQCLNNGRLDFVKSVDGAIISYKVQLIKPNKAIYEALYKTYNLIPQECLFFDDRPENIQGAINTGMKACLFTTYEEALKQIEHYQEG